MLTNLRIRNFKQFDDVEIELGNPVVFIGPNNSGKTTALQALALWDTGVRLWNEKRGGRETPSKRPGVTINRRDLISIPVPHTNLLWRDLHTRDVTRENGKPRTKNILVEITVEGTGAGGVWECGLEFDYANDESLYCRPRRLDAQGNTRMLIPEMPSVGSIAFLPPMSGLADREFAKQRGEIAFLIGQGRTAEVLRNLCFDVAKTKPLWEKLKSEIWSLFGVEMLEPQFLAERGEITMAYRNPRGTQLDLSSSGRGLQQILLLLAFLAANPGSVLMLDEPDAHLEILRQRKIYRVLSEHAIESRSQIIAASHSEIVLREAADRDVVVAFLGSRPHRIDHRGAQLVKALRDIPFEDFYLAEQRGWVLYLEGSTDLWILQALAKALHHSAEQLLSEPFVQYVESNPQRARDHFHGLKEAKPDLRGFLLCDRLERPLQPRPAFDERMWRRREIENYLGLPGTLLRYALAYRQEESPGPLFDSKSYEEDMEAVIQDLIPPAALRDSGDRYWIETKVSDDLLPRIFEAFFVRRKIPNLMRKSNYHELARFLEPSEIDPEVTEVLDALVRIGLPRGGH